MNTPTKRESVRQQGSALGQSVVGPSFLDATFHRAQARLKSTPTAVIRAESSRPLFQPELASIESKSNLERLHEWQRKCKNLEAA